MTWAEYQQTSILLGVGGMTQSTIEPSLFTKTKSIVVFSKHGFGSAAHFIQQAYGWNNKTYALRLANYCQMKFGKRKSMDTAQTLGENGYG